MEGEYRNVRAAIYETFLLMQEHNIKVAQQLAVLERPHCTVTEALAAIKELKRLYSSEDHTAH